MFTSLSPSKAYQYCRFDLINVSQRVEVSVRLSSLNLSVEPVIRHHHHRTFYNHGVNDGWLGGGGGVIPKLVGSQVRILAMSSKNVCCLDSVLCRFSFSSLDITMM